MWLKKVDKGVLPSIFALMCLAQRIILQQDKLNEKTKAKNKISNYKQYDSN